MPSHNTMDDECATITNNTDQTDVPNKYELATRIEHILSYLLSRKYNASVKITFKKENYIDGNTNQTRGITKEQILDR